MTERLLKPEALKGSQEKTGSARCWALVPCAGMGLRAVAAHAPAPELPKQYQSVAGQPMVRHTLAALGAVQHLHHTLVVTSPTDTFWHAQPLASYFSVAACGGASPAMARSYAASCQESLRFATSNASKMPRDAIRFPQKPESMARR